MSATLHLECDQCKESLWIGQRDFLYNDRLEDLSGFLFAHLGHALFFRASNPVNGDLKTSSKLMAGENGWYRFGEPKIPLRFRMLGITSEKELFDAYDCHSVEPTIFDEDK